jgi:outer membrane protein assembly factor BamB
VLALDATNGEILWRTKTGARISGGPGIIDDWVVVGTEEAELITLSRLDGEEQWRQKLSSEVLSSPAGEAGILVARTGDGRVTGMTVESAEYRWRIDREMPVLTLRGDSSPLVRDGRVIVGFASGKLASLSLMSGQLVWETTVAVPRGRTELERVVDLDAELVLVEGVVYASSFHGGVAAVSETSGVILWQREISTHAGLDADWRTVYVTDDQDHVWALDASNGATLWQQSALHARRLSAPAIVGEYLVVGDFEGYLHWLAQEDGRFLARVRVGNTPIRTKPLVLDDTIYVLDDAGQLSALSAVHKDVDAPSSNRFRTEDLLGL